MKCSKVLFNASPPARILRPESFNPLSDKLVTIATGVKGLKKGSDVIGAWVKGLVTSS